MTQTARTRPWAKNTDGPRSLEQAIRIVENQGIEIPDDIQVFKSAIMVPADAEAAYFQNRNEAGLPSGIRREDWLTWERHMVNNRTGKVPLRIRPEVFESDEAIVAVFAHELYELNALRDLFDERGAIPAGELKRLISTRHDGGYAGNLHEQAWDEADRKVTEMRSRQRS